MMRDFVSYAKFVVKRIAALLRGALLTIAGEKTSKEGWEKRLLIINLEAMGDIVIFTSVLKHYKKRFPHVKIFLLIKSGSGMENLLRTHFVDEVIAVNYQRFSGDPFYGFRFVNALRTIGFKKVINHDFSVAEIMGKIIAISVGAEEVIGYEGQAIEFRIPFDIQQQEHLRLIESEIFPRFTTIIPRLPENTLKDKRLPSQAEHYMHIYETVTGARETDYATCLPLTQRKEQRPFHTVSGLAKNSYIVLNVNASVTCKQWPLERFSRVLEFFEKQNLKIVLVGAPRERKIAALFQKLHGKPLVNLVGKTSFDDLMDVVDNCFLVLSNDTSTVHIAIARKKPSLCVVGGGQFGVAVEYGYPEINQWVWNHTPCYFDNWRCSRRVKRSMPSPCVDAVSVQMVLRVADTLVLRLLHGTPPQTFFPHFPKSVSREKKTKRIKILYTGIQAENYNPQRKLSFEYSNFYLTLQELPEVEVVEFPYDTITEIGKRKFNENLLELVMREKPDLFFAFMFTDELDVHTLDKIKAMTTSVAWFADDHWRIWNYSRHWVPHFTWAVTTWSKAPEIYAQYGYTNIIRSQWAANTKAWKPVDTPKDIEVAFVGQWNPSRGKIVEVLRRAGIDVWTRGWGWKEGRLSQAEMVRSFSRAKINLNFNTPPSRLHLKMLARLLMRRSINHIVPDVHHVFENITSWYHMPVPQIKARPFEILACNSFLISGYADDMDQYYKGGKEIVYYNGTIKDLVRKIRYYLSRDKEREAIALAGYERTLREHTYEKRFRDVFTAMNLPL